MQLAARAANACSRYALPKKVLAMQTGISILLLHAVHSRMLVNIW